MATDNNQVAISRPTRISSTNASKPSRQAVPAFLQKLFEMVNDTKNQDLIRWSEAGDSFFVLDHERFAREVLGRWFKHQNFSSFVRQLNMYGFHKIPHLQQGVLRSETDTEYWNFAHANFRRGQPDLLCFIQRKKQTAQSADDAVVDVRDPHAASPAAGLSQGQLLDMHSVLQGVAAIRRHQTTISTELNELKQSNQLLWQESIDARTKLQKQQDTINRILKFLAGVFGNQAAGNHHNSSVDAANSSHNVVVPGQRSRLMIEGAKRDPTGKVEITEVEDPEAAEPLYGATTYSEWKINSPTLLFTSDATKDNASSPGPRVNSLTTSTIDSADLQPKSQSQSRPATADPSTSPNLIPRPQSSSALERVATPNKRPLYEVDPRVQNILSNLTPDQISNLFTTLSQTIAETDSGRDPSDTPSSSSQVAFPHTPSTFDFLLGQPPSPLPLPLTTTTAGSGIDQAGGGLLSFDHNMPVNGPISPRLERNWQAAEDVEQDVNAMNREINNLMESLGPYFAELQPMISSTNADDAASPVTTTADTPRTQPAPTPAPSSVTAPATPPQLDSSEAAHADILSSLDPSTNNTSDFDFDAFLKTISHDSGGTGINMDGLNMGMGGYGDDDLNGVETAFLDEVPPPAPTNGSATNSVVANVEPVSPLQTTNVAARTGGAAATRKRKSDAMGDLEGALGAASVGESGTANGVPFPKVKRRKD